MHSTFIAQSLSYINKLQQSLIQYIVQNLQKIITQRNLATHSTRSSIHEDQGIIKKKKEIK